jgi:hypothetical protein
MSDEPNEEKTAMSATENPTAEPAPPHASPGSDEDNLGGSEEEDFADETWDEEDGAGQDELPISRRPRRRLLTPLTALLFAVLVGAGGFIVGVQVEKGEVSSSGGTRGAGRLAALGAGGAAGAGGSTSASGSTGAGGSTGTGGSAGASGSTGAGAGTGGASGGGRFSGFGGGGGAGGGAGATVGQVANISGSDLYVTNLEGNTVKVLASAAQITKQVNTSVKGVHPGDTVVVQGTTRSDGSVQASTVRDSGSSGAGGGIGGLFGGGGAGRAGGASAAGGSSGGSSGGGTGGGEPALFGK